MNTQNFFDNEEIVEHTVTRSQRKMTRKAKRSGNVVQLHKTQALELKYIEPMTQNQELVWKYYKEGKNLLLHGVLGTGKSFCALYLALEEILSGRSKYKRVIIIRSAQSGKDIGFLPGSAKQKIAEFETPYIGICTKLFDNANAYTSLKNKGIIQFESTSFLRGITIDDAIIILDEFQNLPIQGITTVLGRVGDNTKIMLCGDKKQDDLSSTRYSEESGAVTTLRLCSYISSMKVVEFGVDDVVRSGFARELVMAMIKCGI